MLSAYISQRTSNDSTSVSRHSRSLAWTISSASFYHQARWVLVFFDILKPMGVVATHTTRVIKGRWLKAHVTATFAAFHRFDVCDPTTFRFIWNMQEHVKQREDGEVKRPRFHLKFAYRLKVSACVCWRFSPLQLVASLLQSHPIQVLLKWVPWWRRFSPSVRRAFTSRGSRDFCSAVTTVVFWTNTIPGGLRPQLNEMAAMFDGRGWRVDFEKSAMFAELVFWNHDQNLISEFFLEGGEKMCWCTVSLCRMFSSHPKWHLNTFDDSIPKGTFLYGMSRMPTRFKVFQPKKTDNSPKYQRMKGQKLVMLTVQTSISMHPFANDRAHMLTPFYQGFQRNPSLGRRLDGSSIESHQMALGILLDSWGANLGRELHWVFVDVVLVCSSWISRQEICCLRNLFNKSMGWQHESEIWEIVWGFWGVLWWMTGTFIEIRFDILCCDQFEWVNALWMLIWLDLDW